MTGLNMFHKTNWWFQQSKKNYWQILKSFTPNNPLYVMPQRYTYGCWLRFIRITLEGVAGCGHNCQRQRPAERKQTANLRGWWNDPSGRDREHWVGEPPRFHCNKESINLLFFKYSYNLSSSHHITIKKFRREAKVFCCCCCGWVESPKSPESTTWRVQVAISGNRGGKISLMDNDMGQKRDIERRDLRRCYHEGGLLIFWSGKLSVFETLKTVVLIVAQDNDDVIQCYITYLE